MEHFDDNKAKVYTVPVIFFFILIESDLINATKVILVILFHQKPHFIKVQSKH